LATCVAGAGVHVLIDLASGIGVRLWWPLRGGWVAWDWLANFDVFILALLVVGLLLPHFARMVSEEIGEERHGVAGGVGAAITLILLALYVGGRGFLHARTVDLLLSRDYHGEPPQRAGAFASASNPFEWRGVVATPATVEELQLSMLPGPAFDPDQMVAHYKPDDSAAITAAQNTDEGKLFLDYARFPLAAVEPRDDGFEVELRDLRFPADDHSADNVVVSVRVDDNSGVKDESLRYAHARR
jgi:inner membrane protein